VSLQAALNREHDRYISFHFTEVVKYPQFVFPLMPGFARPLNTSKVSGRDSLRDLYKESLTYDNPLKFQAKLLHDSIEETP
jgi:hypothetical protein